MNKIALLLTAIVLVSGCVELEEFFGSGVNQQTTVLSPDIISIGNVNIIPKPPLYTGSEFTLTMEVMNLDTISEVPNVTFSLTDTGLCTYTKVSNNLNNITLYPEQTEFLEWIVNTPTSEQVGNLPSKCALRYSVYYNYIATTQSDFGVISASKLAQMQRAGQTPNFTSSQVVGRGPLKVSFDFGPEQPLRTNRSFNVFVTVEDKGTGLINSTYGNIPVNSLVINIDKALGTNANTCGSSFNCVEDTTTLKCTNNNTISMIKKKSPQIKCTLKTPEESVVPDEKTYFWSAKLNYTYRLDGLQSVDVKPYMQ